jgi:hypothetical protein
VQTLPSPTQLNPHAPLPSASRVADSMSSCAATNAGRGQGTAAIGGPSSAWHSGTSIHHSWAMLISLQMCNRQKNWSSKLALPQEGHATTGGGTSHTGTPAAHVSSAYVATHADASAARGFSRMIGSCFCWLAAHTATAQPLYLLYTSKAWAPTARNTRAIRTVGPNLADRQGRQRSAKVDDRAVK